MTHPIRNTLIALCVVALVPVLADVVVSEDTVDDNYLTAQLPRGGKRSLHPAAARNLALAFRCWCQAPLIDDLNLRALMLWAALEYAREI